MITGISNNHLPKLHGQLQAVNAAILHLKKTPMFGKAEAAQVVIDAQRDLLAEVIFTLHVMHNEIQRLQR